MYHTIFDDLNLQFYQRIKGKAIKWVNKEENICVEF